MGFFLDNKYISDDYLKQYLLGNSDVINNTENVMHVPEVLTDDDKKLLIKLSAKINNVGSSELVDNLLNSIELDNLDILSSLQLLNKSHLTAILYLYFENRINIGDIRRIISSTNFRSRSEIILNYLNKSDSKDSVIDIFKPLLDIVEEKSNKHNKYEYSIDIEKRKSHFRETIEQFKTNKYELQGISYGNYKYNKRSPGNIFADKKVLDGDDGKKEWTRWVDSYSSLESQFMNTMYLDQYELNEFIPENFDTNAFKTEWWEWVIGIFGTMGTPYNTYGNIDALNRLVGNSGQINNYYKEYKKYCSDHKLEPKTIEMFKEEIEISLGVINFFQNIITQEIDGTSYGYICRISDTLKNIADSVNGVDSSNTGDVNDSRSEMDYIWVGLTTVFNDAVKKLAFLRAQTEFEKRLSGVDYSIKTADIDGIISSTYRDIFEKSLAGEIGPAAKIDTSTITSFKFENNDLEETNVSDSLNILVDPIIRDISFKRDYINKTESLSIREPNISNPVFDQMQSLDILFNNNGDIINFGISDLSKKLKEITDSIISNTGRGYINCPPADFISRKDEIKTEIEGCIEEIKRKNDTNHDLEDYILTGISIVILRRYIIYLFSSDIDGNIKDAIFKSSGGSDKINLFVLLVNRLFYIRHLYNNLIVSRNSINGSTVWNAIKNDPCCCNNFFDGMSKYFDDRPYLSEILHCKYLTEDFISYYKTQIVVKQLEE